MASLVLNASYEPLAFVAPERAVRLVVTEKATIIEADTSKVFRSESLAIPYPKVVRLLTFVEVPRFARKKISRKLVVARDKHTCQYCGRHKTQLKKGESLTIEHVKPKSKGGKTEWENVTTACNTCNNKKGDRLPYEAHMYPKTTPKEPRYIAVVLLERADEVQRPWIETWC